MVNGQSAIDDLEQLADVAFHTADGKIVLVMSNTSNFPKTVNVRITAEYL
jgi:hypothetical protein